MHLKTLKALWLAAKRNPRKDHDRVIPSWSFCLRYPESADMGAAVQ
jgi:hypothetical protein